MGSPSAPPSVFLLDGVVHVIESGSLLAPSWPGADTEPLWKQDAGVALTSDLPLAK